MPDVSEEFQKKFWEKIPDYSLESLADEQIIFSLILAHCVSFSPSSSSPYYTSSMEDEPLYIPSWASKLAIIRPDMCARVELVIEAVGTETFSCSNVMFDNFLLPILTTETD